MKLRDLRNQKKMSQEDLAKILGMTRATYANYETGKTQPDLENLIKLADYFNVSLDYLLEHKTNSFLDYGHISQEQEQAFTLMLKLTDFQLDKVVGYMQGLLDK